MMLDWRFKVLRLDRGLPYTPGDLTKKSPSPAVTIIHGELVRGSMKLLGPEGLNLDLDNVRCMLESEGRDLMELNVSGDVAPPFRPMSRDEYSFSTRETIPEGYDDFLVDPGLYLRLV